MFRGYFQAVLIFTLPLVPAQTITYGLVGRKGSLNSESKKYPDGSRILWKHNGDKVVEFNGNEQNVFNPFKDRVTLNWHTAELEITGLTYDDSGDYELDVYSKNLDRLNFKLQVIDEVSKPAISCEIVKEGADPGESGNRATLMCSAEPRLSGFLMKLEWSSHGKVLPGPNATISLGDQHDDEEHNCTVSNPLSSKTTTFTARDCYPATRSTALIVSICVSVAILLVVGIVMLWKLRQKCVQKDKRGVPEKEPFMDGQSNLQSPQPPPGVDTKTDDAKSDGNITEEARGNPAGQAFYDRQSTFRSPQRLASLAPKTGDTVSDENFTEDKRGNPEEEPFVGGQSNFPSPQPPSGLDTKSDDAESDVVIHFGSVKRAKEHFEREIAAQATGPKKPFGEVGSREKESEKETGDDKEINPTPALPNNACTSPSVQPSSPSALNSSNGPHEGDVDEHQEEANLSQVSRGKLTNRESGLEEGKESGSNFKHPVSPSPEHKQKEIAAHEQNAEPTDGDTSPLDESKGPDDQENTSQQLDIPKGSKHENSLPHKLSQPPNAADAAADDQLEKDSTMSDSQSDGSHTEASEDNEEPATQQEDPVTVQAILGEDSEEVLPPDEGKKASTEEQTSEQVEKESQPAKVSQQEEEQSHEDDQEENSRQSESLKSSKQEKHDTVAPDSTTAAAPRQEDNSRHSSQSESSSEEAERGEGEGESKNEQPKDDAGDHEDMANSDQVSGTSDSGTEENIKSGDSTKESPTPEHKTREGANKEGDTS